MFDDVFPSVRMLIMVITIKAVYVVINHQNAFKIEKDLPLTRWITS